MNYQVLGHGFPNAESSSQPLKGRDGFLQRVGLWAEGQSELGRNVLNFAAVKKLSDSGAQDAERMNGENDQPRVMQASVSDSL